jgi:hypothetical protein
VEWGGEMMPLFDEAVVQIVIQCDGIQIAVIMAEKNCVRI